MKLVNLDAYISYTDLLYRIYYYFYRLFRIVKMEN